MSEPVCFGCWYISTTCYKCEFESDCRRASLKPRVDYSHSEGLTRATVTYSSELLDAWAKAISKPLNEEVFGRMASARGYVRERICHDDAPFECAFTCSECRCSFVVWDEDGFPAMADDSGDATLPNYCPSCGAKVVADE